MCRILFNAFLHFNNLVTYRKKIKVVSSMNHNSKGNKRFFFLIYISNIFFSLSPPPNSNTDGRVDYKSLQSNHYCSFMSLPTWEYFLYCLLKTSFFFFSSSARPVTIFLTLILFLVRVYLKVRQEGRSRWNERENKKKV